MQFDFSPWELIRGLAENLRSNVFKADILFAAVSVENPLLLKINRGEGGGEGLYINQERQLPPTADFFLGRVEIKIRKPGENVARYGIPFTRRVSREIV